MKEAQATIPVDAEREAIERERQEIADKLTAIANDAHAARLEIHEIDGGPVGRRWYEAHEVAKRLRGVNDRFARFARWFLSDRPAEGQTWEERPDPNWPSALRFDDTDRAVLHRRNELQREVERLDRESNALRADCATLKRQAQELAEGSPRWSALARRA